MPKFSAYMRGEKGPPGNTGSAALYDAFLNSVDELPPMVNADESRAYYVRISDKDVHLFISPSGTTGFEDLGSVVANFSDSQSTKITIIPWDSLASINITSLSSFGGEKQFLWEFEIPRPREPGFSTSQLTSVTSLPSSSIPFVSVSTINSSPYWDKQFKFNFGIPKGEPAGFSTNIGVSVTTLLSSQPATVSISTDPLSPETSKKFNFHFGIPIGKPAGFGDINVNTLQIEPGDLAEVSITTSGLETAKNFDFTFKIPKGQKGDIGDSLGIYLETTFLSTDFDSNSSIYWDNNNILHIKRNDNSKIPIYILNNQNNNIAATFELTETETIYRADSLFDGTLYLISKSNIPKFYVHNCITIPSNMEPYVEAYYPNEFDPSTVYLDFYLTKNSEISSSTDINGNKTYTIDEPKNFLKALNISFTTNDIGVGSSLSTGAIVFVYED